MEMGFHNTTQATSLAEAKVLLSQQNFDLLFLDWMLDDGDCFDVISFIEQLDANKFSQNQKAIKIVVTGKDSPDDITRLRKYNIHNHFIKPFTYSYFKEKLETVLNKK